MPDHDDNPAGWVAPTAEQNAAIVYAARVQGCTCTPDVHIVHGFHACLHHKWHCKLPRVLAARWN